MSKIAVITDSNAHFTPQEEKELGISVVPMPFTIGDKTFYEGVTLSREEFYAQMESGANIVTSQPSPSAVMDIWDKALETHDEVVYIPMSSGLSGSCQSARMLADDYDGKVQVVNNQRISVTQKRSVQDALEMAQRGMSAAQIRQELEHAQIYLEIETMMFPYIRVQYEINDDHFLLPVLTLQPLVENAVRHGVRGRESGEILISTRKEADHHTIVIRDNGKGFVPDAVSGSDGTHIGIRNVRERLDKLCGGTLQIESTPGEGTTVTMIVPASRREDPSAGTRVGRNHT